MEQTCNVVEMSAGSDYRRRLLEDRQLALRAAAGMTAAAQQQQQQQQEGGAALTEVPLQQQQQCFLHPLGPHTSAQLDAAWAALVASGGATPGTSPAPAAPAARPASVPVLFGRSLDVPAAVGGAARFEFPQLCARPLGPADYAALAGAFHTVVISDIPVMSMQVGANSFEIVCMDPCHLCPAHRLAPPQTPTHSPPMRYTARAQIRSYCQRAL
eukprot:244685-Chlamydomonas_euryale.AAC.3